MFVEAAIRELYPEIEPFNGREYAWGNTNPGEPPQMARWDADKLGPLDLAAIEAKAAEIAARPVPVVETVIAGYPRDIRIWFSDAGVWERWNPYVIGIGIELGLTEAQLDQMFRDAVRVL